MIEYNLNTIEAADKLIKLCSKYPALEIDLRYGRYTVDGKSYLGVESLIGHKVIITAMGEEELAEKFYKEVRQLGN